MRTKTIKRERQRGSLLNRDTQYKEGLKIWIPFWRSNIHRFIMDYFECTELKIFQNILLWLMSKNVMFVYIASRGQGKSMIVSWFACAYAVLYPAVEIVITSGKFCATFMWKHIMKNWSVSVKAKSEMIC